MESDLDFTQLQAQYEQSLNEPSSDKYFWAYMSCHPEIIESVYQEELCRQNGIDCPKMLHHLGDPIPLEEVRLQNISYFPSMVHGQWRQFGYYWFYSATSAEANDYLHKILTIDRTKPERKNTYFADLREREGELFSSFNGSKEEHEDVLFSFFDEYDQTQIEEEKKEEKVQIQEKVQDEGKRNENEQRYEDLWEKVVLISTIPGAAICGGLPAKCIYQKWKHSVLPVLETSEKEVPNGQTVNLVNEKFDIDIFIYRSESFELAETVKNILDLFKGETIIDSENVICWKSQGITFQIIKRYYPSVNAILLGFDLDSSAAAFVDGEFYIHQRFIRAVSNGANLIIPMRQSTSYTYRLKKYLSRGFTIWVPGDVHLNKKNTSLIKRFTEMFKIRSPSTKDISDYDPKGIEIMLIYGDEYFQAKFPGTYITHSPIDFSQWRTQDPGTQITGTFHPTMYDYLSGECYRR